LHALQVCVKFKTKEIKMSKSILVGLIALGLVACGGEAPAPAEAPAAEATAEVVEAAPADAAAVEAAPAADAVVVEAPAAQ